MISEMKATANLWRLFCNITLSEHLPSHEYISLIRFYSSSVHTTSKIYTKDDSLKVCNKNISVMSLPTNVYSKHWQTHNQKTTC